MKFSFRPALFASLLLPSLILLPGCSKSSDQKRIDGFIEQFSNHSRELKAGGTAIFKIEGLAAGERLIVANGAQGRVSDASGLDAGLAGQIEKRIGVEDQSITLLLFVRDGRIVGEEKVSAGNLITTFVPVENNVKVAEGDRELYIECIARPAPVDGNKPSHVWNKECYSVLAELDL